MHKENDENIQEIRSLRNSSLLTMYNYAVKKQHYDPCDNMYEPPFSLDELRAEICRRMGNDHDS